MRAKIVPADDAPHLDARRAVPWTELLPGLLMLADAASILLAGGVTYAIMVETSAYVLDFYAFAVAFVMLIAVLLLRSGGMYRAPAILSVSRRIDTAAVSVVAALLFLLAILHALRASALYQTDWLIIFGASATVTLIASRLASGALIHHLLRHGRIGRRMAVLGTDTSVRRFLERLSESRTGLTAVTAIFASPRNTDIAVIAGHPVAGGLYDLVQTARQRMFDDIVIALPDSEAELRAETVELLRELPVDVYLAPSFSEFGTRLRPARFQENLPVFEVWQRPISGWSRVLKLIEDYLLATVALILLLPALCLIAIAIRLDSPGPVLFRQKRLGFNNEVFEIFKFRTMYANNGHEARVVQASRGDTRITRVGRFLRRTSLDELPQLLNVLNGTMSLVGPRPHALSHNADFSNAVRGYFGRHKVRPGITGWAQVNGLRGEIDCHDKLVARINHDVHYAENWSLLFDLRILIVTCFVVLFQRNAY